MKMTRRRKKLGMVLSGGGARGVFQVGVYERLLRDPRFSQGPAVLSGTSAGAINSALIAAGKTPDEIMDFWNGIAENPPAAVSPQFFDSARKTLVRLATGEAKRWLSETRSWRAMGQRARNHWPPRRGSLMALIVEYILTSRFELVSKFLEGVSVGSLADTSQLRERLIETFGGYEVPNTGVDLAINTVDARTGQVVRFVTSDTPATRTPDYVIVDAITVDMVLASASIPLLFPPVEIGPHLLWDGGLLVNTPLAPVVALGAEEIVTVLVTEPPAPVAEPLDHFGRAVERTLDAFLENAYNVDRKLMLERNRLAALHEGDYREVTLYEALRPPRNGAFDAGSFLYFDQEVIEQFRSAGELAAAAWLAEGPPVDHLEETEHAQVIDLPEYRRASMGGPQW
jgi:NTE family protein